jgi:hypothetical protein
MQVLFALGRQAKTVLIIDQLDALSDLVDLKSQRLGVILALLTEASKTQNVRVVCSARSFDYRHDPRFQALDATEVVLSPIPTAEVDRVLRGAGYATERLTPKLKALLQIPYWLKTYIRLELQDSLPSPTSGTGLLDVFWHQNVCSPPSATSENEQVVAEVAAEISNREELWIPRAFLAKSESAVQRLLAAGVLAQDRTAKRISFAHQALYEFARARSFVCHESLVGYVISRQDALFVRPAIWMALGYLRGVDPSRYNKELHGLWSANLRAHLSRLVVEFVAQIADPTQDEIKLLAPRFQEERWSLCCFMAASHSPGWRAYLRRGLLFNAMCGPNPWVTYSVLVASLKDDAEATLSLMSSLLAETSDRNRFVLDVLMQLDDWSNAAGALAVAASVKCNEDFDRIALLMHQLAVKAPEYGVSLAVRHFERTFEILKSSLRYTPRPSNSASQNEWVRWHISREPRESIHKYFDETSRVSALTELAKGAPGEFLERLVPWLVAVLQDATDPEDSSGAYRRDFIVDLSRDGGPVRQMPHALRLAAELLAQSDAHRFLRLVQRWCVCDLHTVHALWSYGLEALGASNPLAVVDYLLGDPRRLCLGTSPHGSDRTVALLKAIEPSVELEQVRALERSILQSNVIVESLQRPVDQRRNVLKVNRHHRARLLAKLPRRYLSDDASGLLDRESRVFELHVNEDAVVRSFTMIESPMSAAQMEKAPDDDILNLFEELTDRTGWDHPRRDLQGGAVQASRELAEMAKKDVPRALTLVRRLRPGSHDDTVGAIIDALAVTNVDLGTVCDLIVECDARGFASPAFRTDAARALGRRAVAGLPPNVLALLERWLATVSNGPRTAPRLTSDKDAGRPPFLDSFGLGFSLPPGNYPVLDTLLVALLSCVPRQGDELLRILLDHVERDEAPVLWKVFAHRLQWLQLCDPMLAEQFLDKLIFRYPEVLETAGGVEMLAAASRWATDAKLDSWVRAYEQCVWRYSKHAQGELVALRSFLPRTAAWAQNELTRMLGGSGANDCVIGIAHAISYLWPEPSARGKVADVLVELIERGLQELDVAALRKLSADPMVGDEHSVRLLRALVERTAPLPLVCVDFIVPWALKLLFICPELVLRFSNRLLDECAVAGENLSRLNWQSTLLAQIAVGLQRTTEFRGQGLDLFERLLELGLNGATEAMKEIDQAKTAGA